MLGRHPAALPIRWCYTAIERRLGGLLGGLLGAVCRGIFSGGELLFSDNSSRTDRAK